MTGRPTGHRLPDVYLPLARLAPYAGVSVSTMGTWLVQATSPLPHCGMAGKAFVKAVRI